MLKRFVYPLFVAVIVGVLSPGTALASDPSIPTRMADGSQQKASVDYHERTIRDKVEASDSDVQAVVERAQTARAEAENARTEAEQKVVGLEQETEDLRTLVDAQAVAIEETASAPPVTSAPAVAEPSPAPATDESAAIPAPWAALAQCESTGNWAINTGNGYYGGLQFNLETWQAYGGEGMPHESSPTQQIEIAKRVQAKQGWGAWPACSRKIGLR